MAQHTTWPTGNPSGKGFFCAICFALAGSKDHPDIERFAGSSIVAYDVQQFDSVDILTSSFVKFNLALASASLRLHL